MDEFRAGVTAVLRTWSAFRTAVESHWGGDDSLQKAEDLRRNIFQHFNGQSVPPKSMPDVTDLEDALAIYMEEEFSLTLEDNSEKEIANMIWQMYDNCARGDFRLALQMVATADQIVATVKAVYPVRVQAPEHDDEDESDDERMLVAPNNEEQEGVDTVGSSMVPEPIPQSVTGDMAAYAATRLFGPVFQPTVSVAPPIRQLGEQRAVAPSIAPDVDDEGFAPVKRKGKPS
jgi:pre-rRNA-processing protein TSR2